MSRKEDVFSMFRRTSNYSYKFQESVLKAVRNMMYRISRGSAVS